MLDRKQETGGCRVGLGVLMVELHLSATRGCSRCLQHTCMAKERSIKSRSKIVLSEATFNKIIEI